MKTRRQVASLLVLGAMALAIISVGPSFVHPSSADSSVHVASSSSAGALVGGQLWLNDSYPFQSEAASSTILALPALSSWLISHNVSVYLLRPYDSLWSSSGNPYDFPQGTVGFDNGAVYDVYTYIMPNGTCIGVWISQASPRTVGSIYTFPSQGSLSYLGQGPTELR